MGDGSHLVVVHALHLVDLVVQVADLAKALFREDVARGRLEGHGHHVGAAEGLAHLVVGTDVFVPLGQEIREAREHFDSGDLVGEDRRRDRHDEERDDGVVDPPFRELEGPTV